MLLLLLLQLVVSVVPEDGVCLKEVYRSLVWSLRELSVVGPAEGHSRFGHARMGMSLSLFFLRRRRGESLLQAQGSHVAWWKPYKHYPELSRSW